MDKEKKNNGKKKLIITMAVALILLVGVTVSYGYIALVSSSKNQEISVGTGNIHLELDDADSGNINATLELGQSITKTLKITNKGTKPGKVQINWKNLINTYNSRSLSYTLESSSNKTSGYTKVETLRENVPVSTEAKEVPLSKEITIPVQSAPIYYRVTITFNNLSDVDQSGDVNATLVTQFSLTEPENLSKKVIAVLDGSVKNENPDFTLATPGYIMGTYQNGTFSDTIDNLYGDYDYLVYGFEYKTRGNGQAYLKDPQVGKYSEIFNKLNGAYVMNSYNSIETANNNLNTGASTFDQITNATVNRVEGVSYRVGKMYSESEPTDYTRNMSSYQDRYITYGTSYTFEADGRYVLHNSQVCKYSECYSNLVGKYISRPMGSTSNAIDTKPANALYLITSTSLTSLSASQKSREEPLIDSSKNGVYASDDDYGKSYYYRGDTENNFVKFGGFYWRIIRVNGDGSVRMIYWSDANKENKYGPVSIPMANYSGYGGIKNAGYMYGGATEDEEVSNWQEAIKNKYSSSNKILIDTWYKNNLTSYSNYISDTLFCNDREIDSIESSNAYNYFKNYYGRIFSSASNPSLKCSQKNDRFTVEDRNIGNGALTYPVGLITADEIMMAGVSQYSTENAGAYIGDYQYLTTMTPSKLLDTSAVYLWDLSGYRLAENTVNYYTHLTPVINIKSEYALKMVGNGTEADPFKITGVN